MSDSNTNFPHIFTASSTLLGLCFIVLTSMKVSNAEEASLVDEFTAIAILMFMISSILSYLSIRINRNTRKIERTADVAFLAGPGFLFLTTMLIAFNVIH